MKTHSSCREDQKLRQADNRWKTEGRRRLENKPEHADQAELERNTTYKLRNKTANVYLSKLMNRQMRKI